MSARLLAEFVGTFSLVFTACNNNMASSDLGALSIASALMVCIYALGSVSGGHFNPAVSAGLAFVYCVGHEGVPALTAVKYSAVQLAAGVCAGFASALLWGTDVGGPSSTLASTGVAIDAGNSTYPAVPLSGAGSPYGLEAVYCCEMVFTAVLVFVVLNVATFGDEKGKNNYVGLAIGFVIVAGASAIGHVSGCSLNPAVSLGVSMSAGFFAEHAPWSTMLQDFFFYTAAELSGASLGFGLFVGCRLYLLHLFHDDHDRQPALWSKMLSEFLGTFVLVLTVCLVVAQTPASPTLGVLGIASSLMSMIYSLAAVSGANFNPAVSLSLLLIGKLPPVDFAAYIAAQMLASLAAVTTAHLIEWEHWHVTLVADVSGTSQDTIAGKGSWGAIVGAEIFYTFLLVLVVLNVAVRAAPNQFYGLAIGFVIVAGGVAVGGLSGGCFNPAVAAALEFGGVFGSARTRFGSCVAYMLSEVVGALLAVGIFKGVSREEVDPDDELMSGSEYSDEKVPLTPHKVAP